MAIPTPLGEVMRKDKEAARAMVRRAIWQAKGSTTEAAMVLGISRPFMQYALRRLGIVDEPKRIRTYLQAMFRAPLHIPVVKACA